LPGLFNAPILIRGHFFVLPRENPLPCRLSQHIAVEIGAVIVLENSSKIDSEWLVNSKRLQVPQAAA
jgi:hypothetical protein